MFGTCGRDPRHVGHRLRLTRRARRDVRDGCAPTLRTRRRPPAASVHPSVWPGRRAARARESQAAISASGATERREAGAACPMRASKNAWMAPRPPSVAIRANRAARRSSPLAASSRRTTSASRLCQPASANSTSSRICDPGGKSAPLSRTPSSLMSTVSAACVESAPTTRAGNATLIRGLRRRSLVDGSVSCVGVIRSSSVCMSARGRVAACGPHGSWERFPRRIVCALSADTAPNLRVTSRICLPQGGVTVKLLSHRSIGRA